MANILELILKARDEASAQLKAAAQQMGTLTEKLGEHEKALKKIALAGGAVGASLGLLIKSAADEEAGIVRLSVALRNVGISYDQVKGSLEGVILATQRKTGIADDQQREAISRLLYITQDYDLALSALPAVLDMASARGMDLAAVGDLIGRGLIGNTEMLKRYGIELAEDATATDVLAAVTKAYGGTAEEMGETAAGAFNKLKAAIGDTMETFGELLLPIFEKAAAALQNLAQWVEKIPDPLKKIGLALMGAAAVGGVVAGLALMITTIEKAIGSVLALAKALGILQAMTGPAGVAMAIAGLSAAAIIAGSPLFKGAVMPEGERAGRLPTKEEMFLSWVTPAQRKEIIPAELPPGGVQILPPTILIGEVVHPLREMFEKQAQESLDLAEATKRSWLDSLKEIGDKELAMYSVLQEMGIKKELAVLEFSKDSRKALLDYEIEQANILRDTQLVGVRAWIDELTAGANLENDNRRAEHKAELDLIEEKRRKELELIDLYASIWRGTTGIAWTPPVPGPVGGFRPPELKDITGWVPLPGQKIEVDIRFRGGMADLFEVAGYAINTQARVPAE